ncbi:AAA family ATPase [Kitasatospora sp. NPDC048540]|uniref:AAA family ATPase n=1 Tax=unclassified Kitasatospora TaxID=2633591 RepID=UPI000539E2E7|nr:AAA family ATPase [Kitasatospora sp. MBT63]
MLDASDPDRTPDTPPGSLVGRSPDLARFDDFIAGIPDAGGSVVLLGEPGVGKTALLDAAAAKARARGLRVLQATGGSAPASAVSVLFRSLGSSRPVRYSRNLRR